MGTHNNTASAVRKLDDRSTLAGDRATKDPECRNIETERLQNIMHTCIPSHPVPGIDYSHACMRVIISCARRNHFQYSFPSSEQGPVE